MHLVDVATGMQLKSTGQGEKCVPFVYQKKQKMTVYKGDAALETRRAVASKLTASHTECYNSRVMSTMPPTATKCVQCTIERERESHCERSV